MNAQVFAPPSVAKQRELWEELYEAVESAELLKRQYLFYTLKILFTLCLLGASILCLVVVANFWAQMANALFMAFVSTQIMLTGHSSMHEQIFGSRRNNHAVSLAVVLLAGVCTLWWRNKHNEVHHGNPNNVDFDGDVRVSVLAFTEEQALSKRGFPRFVTRYQHWLFVPVLFLTALSFRAASIHYLLFQSKKVQPAGMAYFMIELALIMSHIIGYLFLLLFLSDPWWHMVPFALVHQGFTGLYMGSLFATNHKGMAMFEGQEEDSLGFFVRQVVASRDVTNPPWADPLFGGLNSQIEHHLFPSMPENNLRKARGIVRVFCKRHGIGHYETGVVRTCVEIFRHFRGVSAPLRARPASVPS